MTSDEFVVAACVIALIAAVILLAVARAKVARRLEVAEQEIIELHRRLAEAEAARRRAKQRAIAILEAARPRSLTDTARDRLSVRLSEIRTAFIHLRAHDDAETLAYAGELIQVCQGAGVRVTFERFAGRATGAMIGDTIHLRGTENSRLVLAAPRSAKVQLRDITHSELLVPAGGGAAGAKAPPDVVITLNERLPIEVRAAAIERTG